MLISVISIGASAGTVLNSSSCCCSSYHCLSVHEGEREGSRVDDGPVSSSEMFLVNGGALSSC